MTTDDSARPDPEAFLKVANDSESRTGKLTIFFGAAPGVGKTYAMLQEAQNRKREGVNVVVGYVEPHKRKETEVLLAGLAVIPPKEIRYKELVLLEADLDAIIRQKPGIVLVDELAHTNAPGSRHEKRCQDVDEILKAGIDVYTTLNVQHLESLNDVVFNITGIQVKETVPDVVFYGAAEVKIIDLPPKELLKRLSEGKVYLGETARQAADKFFTRGNLTALRELALRCIAASVDKEVDSYRRLKAIKDPWPVADKILVGLFSSPSAEHLVRSAFRFSSELNAKWVALHVVTERDRFMTEQEKSWLTKAVDLAKELGAEVALVKGNSVADEIIRYAQDHNISKIILGKPQKLRASLPFTWRILKGTKGIDIFWFSHEFRKNLLPERKRFVEWTGLLWGCLWVAAAALAGHALRGYLSEANMLFLMLLPVVVVAIRFNRRAAMFSAMLSVILFDYLFVKPYYTFSVDDAQYLLSFVAFATIAFYLSNLGSKLRFQVAELRRSEAQSAALYNVTSDLLLVRDADQVAGVIVKHVRRIIPCEAGVFFFDENQDCRLQRHSPGFVFDDKERAVALWVYRNGQSAGPGTKTLREAKALYLPVKVEALTRAVIGVMPSQQDFVMTADYQLLFESIGRLGTLVLNEKFR